MSNEPGERADLGGKLIKISVPCYNKCGREVNITVWPTIKRLPRMICSPCKNRANEIGSYWC